MHFILLFNKSRKGRDAGEILAADRAYGNRTGMAHVARQGAFFVVRFA